MPSKEHWEQVYSSKATDAVSWFQPQAERSLRLIGETAVPRSAAIIDIGGGASTLVDGLLAAGYSNITVLDLSAAALTTSRKRLRALANQVEWRVADITRCELPALAYDVWHDRAVFHFLTDPGDRQAYVQLVLRSLKTGGHAIISTFAEDGPEKCSGLPVMRYSADGLLDQFGAAFELVKHENELHQTPFGTSQSFTYCHFRKLSPPSPGRAALIEGPSDFP